MIQCLRALMVLALLGACRGAELPNREHSTGGESTGSPYSTGPDSGAAFSGSSVRLRTGTPVRCGLSRYEAECSVGTCFTTCRSMSLA
jgi:hypothetical protein